MDPVTHAVAGFVAGAAGGGGEAEIVAAVIGSLAPDAEFVTRKIPRTAFLDYHHGLIHAAFGGILAAAGVAAVCGWVAGAAWVSLFPFALAGVVSHIVLDLLMHNNGIALWAPFSRKRVAFPIVLGLNPRTASKHCKEGRYGTCFACQARGALRNPFLWVLLSGATVGLLVPTSRQSVASASIVLLSAYAATGFWRKRTASRLLPVAEVPFVRERGFPASANARQWLIVRETEACFDSFLADTRNGSILRSRSFPKLRMSPVVRKCTSLHSVRGFRNSVIFPYWTHEIEDDIDHIIWRDLSYSFSEDVELYTLHIRVGPAGEIIQNEFHERW